MGQACQRFHDEKVRNLRCERVQADEAWAFCYAKEKNLPDGKRDQPGVGSVWTWTAIDADTKLMISWHLGKRDQRDAIDFMLDLAGRILTRIQLTTDGLGCYPRAVWEAFGTDIDFAQLVKTYAVLREPDVRYSPPVCTGAFTSRVCGSPIPEDISTSYVERANLTLRMGQRRYTRLTNAFSKKFENLCWSVALFFTYYNFCKVHKTLRVTPAMEAGLTDHVWEIGELVGLLETEELAVIGTERNKRGKYKKRER
jgi:IS1 family transposase